PGMDLLRASAQRSGTLLTVSLTLNAAPTATAAFDCSADSVTTGGVWGLRFWAASGASSSGTDDFYVAYRDNPPDGGPCVEAGRMDNDNVTVTSTEFDPQTGGPSHLQPGTPGGKSLPQTPE